MAHVPIKYGYAEGPGKGREILVRASNYFHRRGGHFVCADTNGAASLITTEDTGKILGWLESPKDSVTASETWMAVAAGTDTAFVIMDTDSKFWVKYGGAVNATLIGKGADLTTSGSGGNMIQKVTNAGCLNATALVRIYDYDNDDGSSTASLVLVGLNPGNLIA
jgi:hypothetical protein